MCSRRASTSEARNKEGTVETEEQAHLGIKEEPVSPRAFKVSYEESVDIMADSAYLQFLKHQANWVEMEEQVEVGETELNKIKEELKQPSSDFALREELVKDDTSILEMEATDCVKEESIDVEETLLNRFNEDILPLSSNFILCENQVKDKTPNDELQAIKPQMNFVVKQERIDAGEPLLNTIKEETLPVPSKVLLHEDPIKKEPLTVDMQDSSTYMARHLNAKSSVPKNCKTVSSLGPKRHSVHDNIEETNRANRELSRGKPEQGNFIKPAASYSSCLDENVGGEGGEEKGETRRKTCRGEGENLIRAAGEGKTSERKRQNSSSKHSGKEKKRGKTFLCATCGKRFPFLYILKTHERTHTGERPFQCALCNKTFAIKGNLLVHERVHSEERPFKCSMCGKSFKRCSTLHMHLRFHRGEKPFPCRLCGKAFVRKGDVTRHMRCHTHEKPYECTVCGKSFTQAGSLTTHTRSHTGEKPYICTKCGKGFVTNSHLAQHMRVHSAERRFACEDCGRRFSTSGRLLRHKQREHGLASVVP